MVNMTATVVEFIDRLFEDKNIPKLGTMSLFEVVDTNARRSTSCQLVHKYVP